MDATDNGNGRYFNIVPPCPLPCPPRWAPTWDPVLKGEDHEGPATVTVRQAVIRERDYGTPLDEPMVIPRVPTLFPPRFYFPYFGYFRAGTLLRKNTGDLCLPNSI